MATIFMAKKGDNPLGFYSTHELAALVSPNVVEIDVPILEGVSNGCVFFADAVYCLFSMNNGIPKETNVIIGPYISRSANVALNDLHAEVARRRLSGCELNHFLCFELDRFYGEPLVEEPTIYNDPCAPHFTCPGDCKNDPQIQKTWDMLSKGITWDLNHLTLNQLIQELSMYKPGIDLHNRYYSFTTNLVIKSLLEMCKNNTSVCVLTSGDNADELERVSLNEVGYIVFMDAVAAEEACTKYSSLQKEKIRTWRLSDVFEYFIRDEEYGIYFVQSLGENRYLFVSRTLIRSTYRTLLMLKRAEIKDDDWYYEFALTDSERALLDSPQWWMAWKVRFISEGTKLISYVGEDKQVIIPEGITIIANEAFCGTKIESICIPSSVQKIENSAFQDCLRLKKVEFKGEAIDLDYSTFSNCRNLTTVSVTSSIGLFFSGLLHDASQRYLDPVRIDEDLETILSVDDFSGTPIKRKIYDPKCRDLSYIDVSEEIIDLAGDIIETIEIVNENAIRIKTEKHLMEIEVSRKDLYTSAGFLLPNVDLNTFIGSRVLKCYVTDGYDLHSYYYSEIEQKLNRDRSKLLPELYKAVFETDGRPLEILLYNAYNDWFENTAVRIEIIFDRSVVSAFCI